MIDEEARLAAERAKVMMTKADRRAILRALANEHRRLSRKPTEKQSAKQGFLSTRAVEHAEVIAAYKRISAIDPANLPHRIVTITQKEDAQS